MIEIFIHKFHAKFSIVERVSHVHLGKEEFGFVKPKGTRCHAIP